MGHMFERELFAFLERTADAAYTVTADGTIRSWNAAAAQLFGYSQDEALRRNIHDLLDARDSLGTHALSGGMGAATRRSDVSSVIAAFDLDVRIRDGSRIWINVSTIMHDDDRTGRRLIVRLARDVTAARRREELTARFVSLAREISAVSDRACEQAPVTALTDQERRILALFAKGRSAPIICQQLCISSQTLRNHLHRINQKLRTHNRLEAVTHAQQRGLIDN